MKFGWIALSLVALASTAQADVFTYSSALTGSTGANGSATLTLDNMAKTLQVDVSFTGLTTNNTAAHIHCCTTSPSTLGAGVAIDFAGFPTGATSGSYSHLFNLSLTSTYGAGFLSANGGTADGAFAALMSGLNGSRAYVNIHTPTVPSGELTGFTTAVPEPASVGLMALGVSTLLLAKRRRRQA